MPNKAVEDDGDKRVFFGLRERVTGDACFAHSPPPAHLPHSRFSHRASPLTLIWLRTCQVGIVILFHILMAYDLVGES